jgi:ABC-type transport system involved in multi-copper enzyme maturation permease subunit
VLCYKAWLETRSRFLTCLTVLALFSAVFIHHAQGFLHPEWKTDFYRLLFISQEYVVFLWILSVVLLGMGGLVREHATGTSSLSLSLPVSRAHLLAVRITVGVLEAIALGVLPWATIFLVSRAGGMPILFPQVAFYTALLLGGGMAYFAIGFFVSSIVEGEYTAPAVAIGLVFLATIFFDTWLRRFNLWRLITGSFSIDRTTYLLAGHFPWLAVLASLCAAALMLLASVRIIQRRDF